MVILSSRIYLSIVGVRHSYLKRLTPWIAKCCNPSFPGRQIPILRSLPHLKEATFHAKIFYPGAIAMPFTPFPAFTEIMPGLLQLTLRLESNRSNHLIISKQIGVIGLHSTLFLALMVAQPRSSTCLSVPESGARRSYGTIMILCPI